MTGGARPVSIVVLNWNEWRYTAQCIQSLQQLDYPTFDIVVVDNHSSDDSVAELHRAFPDVTIVETEKNLGFAAGCNRGIVQALGRGAEYVWLLNNDTVVAPDSLRQQIAAAESHGQPCIVGSTLLDLVSNDVLQTMGGAYRNRWTGKLRDRVSHLDPLDYVVGASMLIRRSVIETVGLLDEWYFFYWEDADYCHRATAAGYRLLVANDSRVYHRGGASSGDDDLVYSRDSQADFHIMRGAVRFLYRYDRWIWPIPLTALTLKCAILSVRRRNGLSFNRIPVLLRGVLSGCKDLISVDCPPFAVGKRGGRECLNR